MWPGWVQFARVQGIERTLKSASRNNGCLWHREPLVMHLSQSFERVLLAVAGYSSPCRGTILCVRRTVLPQNCTGRKPWYLTRTWVRLTQGTALSPCRGMRQFCRELAQGTAGLIAPAYRMQCRVQQGMTQGVQGAMVGGSPPHTHTHTHTHTHLGQ